ncbi:glycosyltransferase family 61 protein [Limimaricola variabilis]|uniref:glycosyltransferase family 61 protein n=1 Tax=Limimaricola variabilis TaxID=1492771 RepID=UPI002AC9B182|nr:glycosyltransferase family 61 protein [Limimaricola variabilis]WPY95565.1 glycosyltransferase family 61 protein [Limimaricola variabilis]
MIDDLPPPPDLSRPIQGLTRCLDRALVVPPPIGAPNRAVQHSGVLTEARLPVPEAITWRGDSAVTLPPPPPSGPVETLAGRWLFLGPLFGHFGHFLVESIARLWALEGLRDEIDGVLFVPKFQHRVQQVADTYRPFLAALGVDLPMRSLERPTRVERLHVPVQGFGMFGMIEGAAEFRRFMREHAGKAVAPAGAERIYISRSGLPVGRGSILGEARLEAWLADQGYSIFHPQQHDFTSQIAAYKAAREIVAVDCSPLHLLALVGDAEQKVGIIARRPGRLAEIFARQLRAFSGARATAIDALQRNWIEEKAQRPNRLSWGEVDFAAIQTALARGGLVSAAPGWSALGDEDVAAQIDRIAAASGTRFRPYEE